jgi:ribonuclease HI
MKLTIYTDGGCRGNPGPGAIGILILDDKSNIVKEHKEYIGQTTNNRAEYSAMIKALELAKQHCTNEIICFSDSRLIVKQLSGEWKVKEKELLLLFQKVKELENNFQSVTYNHVRRDNPYITRADELVNEELDIKNSEN